MHLLVGHLSEDSTFDLFEFLSKLIFQNSSFQTQRAAYLRVAYTSVFTVVPPFAHFSAPGFCVTIFFLPVFFCVTPNKLSEKGISVTSKCCSFPGSSSYKLERSGRNLLPCSSYSNDYRCSPAFVT